MKQIQKGWLVLILLLWLANVVTALMVVKSTHSSRHYLHQLELLRRETEQLHVAWGQYLLERSAWGAFSRVEQEASSKLKMHTPEDEELIMVEP